MALIDFKRDPMGLDTMTPVSGAENPLFYRADVLTRLYQVRDNSLVTHRITTLSRVKQMTSTLHLHGTPIPRPRHRRLV